MLKDYAMNVIYHLAEVNVIVDSLCRLSMGSVDHIIKKKQEQAMEVHRLAYLGVCLVDVFDERVVVKNNLE